MACSNKILNAGIYLCVFSKAVPTYHLKYGNQILLSFSLKDGEGNGVHDFLKLNHLLPAHRDIICELLGADFDERLLLDSKSLCLEIQKENELGEFEVTTRISRDRRFNRIVAIRRVL